MKFAQPQNGNARAENLQIRAPISLPLYERGGGHCALGGVDLNHPPPRPQDKSYLEGASRNVLLVWFS